MCSVVVAGSATSSTLYEIREPEIEVAASISLCVGYRKIEAATSISGSRVMYTLFVAYIYRIKSHVPKTTLQYAIKVARYPLSR